MAQETEPQALLKVVVFDEGLLTATLSGDKKITLRRYRPEAHDYRVGELFIGRFREGLDILLRATADTQVKKFEQLTDEEAQDDGFENAQDAFIGMGKYYTDLKTDEQLAILRYEIAKIDGYPAIKLNQFFEY